MWKLKSPSCPLLTKLRKLSTEVTNVTKITLSLGEFSAVDSKLTGSCSAPVVSTLFKMRPCVTRKMQIKLKLFCYSLGLPLF